MGLLRREGPSERKALWTGASGPGKHEELGGMRQRVYNLSVQCIFKISNMAFWYAQGSVGSSVFVCMRLQSICMHRCPLHLLLHLTCISCAFSVCIPSHVWSWRLFLQFLSGVPDDDAVTYRSSPSAFHRPYSFRHLSHCWVYTAFPLLKRFLSLDTIFCFSRDLLRTSGGVL